MTIKFQSPFFWATFCLVAVISQSRSFDKNDEVSIEDLVLEFLDNYDEEASKLMNEMTIASWNYETNITDYNADIATQKSLEFNAFREVAFQNASKFDKDEIQNSTILRMLKFVGMQPLDESSEFALSNTIVEMGKIYGSTKICPQTAKSEESCLPLEPDLANIMADSTDYEERTYYWQKWREEVGRKMKPLYMKYVELKNQRAQLNGYDDYGDEWRSRYESENFEAQVILLYKQVEPLYMELHAYVRRKLSEVYGTEIIDLKGKLPASVLSDMWGRFWNNLFKFVVPFPDKPSIDPSEAMKNQNYTVRKMFETANSFYTTMGLFPVPDTFYDLSMLEKPTDGREVICHATAWDFYDKKDYRIRMCTRDFSFEDLNTIHHELGHIQYDQHYKNLNVVFRDGANDGFHEAIGEMMAMAGATPKHLYSIGLLRNLTEDEEQDLNFLMSQALITISTLPFHLVNDLWRWKAFRGEYEKESWNAEYWKLKESIVGVKAPVERTKEDLDPPTIFHINQDFDMIRYFTRTILQFQFAEKLCNISGHTGPLHRCDFSNSTEAGKELGKMLSLGSSVPWQDALEQLTGTREMSVIPILKFFDPLHKWLQETNKKNGDEPGWERNGSSKIIPILHIFGTIFVFLMRQF